MCVYCNVLIYDKLNTRGQSGKVDNIRGRLILEVYSINCLVKFKGHFLPRTSNLTMALVRLFCGLLLLLPGGHSWWIFSSSDSESNPPVKETHVHRPVAFEIESVEHKFLAEAQQFLNIPELDHCQHKVVCVLCNIICESCVCR